VVPQYEAVQRDNAWVRGLFLSNETIRRSGHYLRDHFAGIFMRSMLLWLIGIPIPIIIILWLVTGHA